MPTPSASSDLMRQHYEGPEFARWAEQAVEEDLLAGEKYLIAKYLEPFKSRAVLEVGCGGGRVCFALSRQGFQKVTGVDFSARMVERAKQHQAKRSLPFPVHFQEANAISLPFADHSFSAALYLAHVLCFLVRKEEQEKAIREAFRVLEPGGLALFSVLNFQSRRVNQLLLPAVNLIRVFFNPLGYSGRALPWLKHHNRPNWKFLLPSQPQVYWFLPGELEHDLQEVGFTLLESSADACRSHQPPLPASDHTIFLAAQKPF